MVDMSGDALCGRRDVIEAYRQVVQIAPFVLRIAAAVNRSFILIH
jgi:hypothetical protein